MEYQEKIISSLADRQCKWICQKTIRFLQKMTEGMQSGEDSPLESLWDEICVQIQFEQSMFWDFYLDYIQAIIAQEVKKLDAPTTQAIWLQTDAADEFLFRHEEYEEDGDPDEALEWLCDEDDITNYILNNYVLSKAADWTNAKIEKYLG
jgi:hypothetical protein